MLRSKEVLWFKTRKIVQIVPILWAKCKIFTKNRLEFARYHENVDIWDALIDSGSHKETATETDFCNDCLHEQKDSA